MARSVRGVRGVRSVGASMSASVGVALAALLALLVLSAVPTTDAAVAAIDFGSEWFKVSLVKTGVPMEIVLNRESKRKTAAIVALRNGERFFGEDAGALLTRYPRDTYTRLIEVLGHHADEAVVADYRSRFPNVVEADERGVAAFRGDGDHLFLVEELVAMILGHARDQAAEMAGERIVDVVITVPPYFNQFERQAILDAADLAGLNVLQLINVDTAVALHYGITRKFNTTEYHVFYDMGAASTKASLVAFSTLEPAKGAKGKGGGVAQYQVLAVAYDRTLGGHQFDLRLRKHVAELFLKQKGVKSDVYKNDRAMTKLLKESTRIKQILSANQDTVEQLLDEVDLNVRVTRAEFESISADLFDRVPGPLLKVAELAGIPLANISSVTLMGGGLRIPQVQNVLKATFGRELAQNINGDEAAVLGAAFKGAELSGQFKVKEVKLLDVQPYQINVRFDGPAASASGDEAASAGEDADADASATSATAAAAAQTELVLFPFMSPLNKRKQVNFIRSAPFSFDVVYAGAVPGPTHLGTVLVEGFESEKVVEYTARALKPPKLDSSGIVSVQKAEIVFEVKEVEPAPKKPTIMENIYDFLGMGKDKGDAKDGDADSGDDHDESADSTKPEGDGAAGDQHADPPAADKDGDGTPATEGNAAAAEAADAADSEPVEMVEKVVTKRLRLRTTWKVPAVARVSAAQRSEALQRKADLDKAYQLRVEHSEAFNGLESLIYKATEFLENRKTSTVYASKDELATLRETVAEAKAWFDEVGDGAETHEYHDRSKSASGILSLVNTRMEEERERPEAVEALRTVLKLAKKAAANVTLLIKPDDPNPWYTPEDIEKIAKSVNETTDWLDKGVAEQAKKAAYEPASLTVRDLARRAKQLEKDVIALLKKPKPKPATKKTDGKDGKDSKSSKTDGKTKAEDSRAPPPPTDSDESDSDYVRYAEDDYDGEESKTEL